MKRRSPLVSTGFVALYIVAVAAGALSLAPASWRHKTWFPIATGVTAAIAIIVLIDLAMEFLRDRPGRERRTAIVFFLFAALVATPIPFFVRSDPNLMLCLFCMSGIYVAAGLGTLLGWPGFRSRSAYRENLCPNCQYDLTGNQSGVCPECGSRVEGWEEDI